MRSKKLGRAAAVAGFMVLLAPTVAVASWWDGGYDGRYDNGGYNGRRSAATTTTSRQAEPGYQSPGEGDTPPPSQGCGTNGCYDTPPTTSAPPAAPPPCGQPSCGSESPPPPPCGQPSCGSESPPPPPPPPPLAPIYGCENTHLAGTVLAVDKTTTPPEGAPVAPGDEILVDLTWRVSDFVAPVLHKALDCIYINGAFVPPISLGARDIANVGHFAFRYVVPLDAPLGGTICDQGFVSGPTPYEEYGREISNVVCFPICACPEQLPPPAAPPVETTTTTAPAEAQPYIESVRLSENEVAPAALPEQREVLPRTGSGPATGRLAAAGLGLALLIRRRTRRV